MSVRMRHTRGHTGNRRSHHALKEPRLAKCADCGEMHLRHRICENCGKYRGRLVTDLPGQRAHRQEKRNAKLRSMGEEVNANASEDKDSKKDLDPKKLSKKEKED